MRNTTPMRWIEQAEARDVLATMRFEQTPAPSWCATARTAAADWLARSGAWFVAQDPANGALLQPQPALVRRPVCRPVRDDEDGYSCRW